MRSKARRLAIVLMTLMEVTVLRGAAAEGPAVLAMRSDTRTVGLYELDVKDRTGIARHRHTERRNRPVVAGRLPDLRRRLAGDLRSPRTPMPNSGKLGPQDESPLRSRAFGISVRTNGSRMRRSATSIRAVSSARLSPQSAAQSSNTMISMVRLDRITAKLLVQAVTSERRPAVPGEWL
jgi:hypothetical protein